MEMFKNWVSLKRHSVIIQKYKTEASEMPYLVPKPGDLSSILKTHMTKGKK